MPPTRHPFARALPLVALFATAAVAVEPASTQPADSVATFVNQQREALRQILAEAPTAPAKPIDSLVHFDVVQGRLVVELLDANLPDAQTFALPGKADTAFFLGVNRLATTPPMTMFRAHLMRFDATTNRSIDVDLLPGPSVVNLNITTLTSDVSTTVQLIDQSERGFDSDAQPAVTKLYVQRSKETDASIENANIVTTRFGEMLDQHHDECIALLGEGLTALRAMHIFAGVSAAEAAAIFDADRAIDAATQRELDAIVEDVRFGGSESVATARPRLRKLGAAAVVALARMPRAGWSADESVNIDALTAGLIPAANTQAAALLASPGRLIDLLYSPDIAVRREAIARLERYSGQKIAIDPTADPYAVVAAIEALRSTLLTATTRPTR